MLFVQAVSALMFYDVLNTFGEFKTIYSAVRGWRVAPKHVDHNADERVCMAINYACVWYPKKVLCLQRSFATTYLLRRYGIAAQMVLGAQKVPFKAHAWVEVNGIAVNERSNVQEMYSIWDKC